MYLKLNILDCFGLPKGIFYLWGKSPRVISIFPAGFRIYRGVIEIPAGILTFAAKYFQGVNRLRVQMV